MSDFVPGNRCFTSTNMGVSSDPSTAAILSELTSANFESTFANRDYVVHAFLGGSTAGVWIVEQATSSNVDSTSRMNQTVVYTAAGQTSEFVKRFRVSGVERIRVRHFSSNTGSYHATLQAEELS